MEMLFTIHCLSDCFSLSGKVYNVTQYMDFHPGGRDQLMKAAGADGTQLFNQVNYKREMKDMTCS